MKIKKLFLAALLAAFLCPAHAADPAMLQKTESPVLSSLAGDKSVALPPAKATVSSPKLLTEPDDGRAPLLDAINNARSSVDLSIYELADGQIVGALQKAQQRGVKVRVLYNYYSFQHYSFNPNQWALTQLQPSGVEVKPASKNFTVMHQKTFVVDGTTAVIMSFNLQKKYFAETRDFGYVTSDPGMVGEIARVFEADWSGLPADISHPALVWSPVNAREKITALITGASKTLDMYNQEARDRDVLNAIVAAVKRGVKVRFITAALKDSSTGVDSNQAGRDQLTAAGAQVQVGAGKLYVHAKMVLADYGTSTAKAYLGSENFSYTSLNRNRELGVLITDTTMLNSLAGTFSSDWTTK